MEAWFDEQVDVITNLEGNQVETRRVFFHLRKASMVERAEPFVFDGIATERHMRDYPQQWKAFQALVNPEVVVVPEETPQLPPPVEPVMPPVEPPAETPGEVVPPVEPPAEPPAE